MFRNFCSVCCGEGPEDTKYGALVVDPKLAEELGWEHLSISSKPGASSSEHHHHPRRTLDPTELILQYERQISRINQYQRKYSSKSSLSVENNNGSSSSELNTSNDDIDSDRQRQRATIFRRAISMEDVVNDTTTTTTSTSKTMEVASYPKTEQQQQFLTMALSNHFIFGEMTLNETQLFVGAMQPETVSIGTTIIQQGDTTGEYFYVIESGTVDFVQEQPPHGRSSRMHSTTVGSAGPGTCFGELALIYDTPRAVTVIASSNVVELWKVDQRTFRYVMACHHHEHHTKMKDLISNVSIFQNLDAVTLSRFVKSLTPVHWKEGTRIVQKGEVGHVFYIIESGNVKVHDIGLGDSTGQDRVLGPGDWFGERALLTGEPRAANVTALNDVATMAMDRETFELSLGSLQSLLEREMRVQSLRAIPMFAASNDGNGGSNITDQEIEQLADSMKELCYRKGEHLTEIDKPYDMNLWIIRHGRVVVYSRKRNMLYNLQVGDYYGDKSLKVADPNHLSAHTATCEENLTAWVLSRERIEHVLGDIDRLGQSVDFSKEKHVQSIHLQDLMRHRILGQGAFGRVWLVSHDKPTGSSITHAHTPYALKSISKSQVLDSHLENAVKRERELLGIIAHPLVCPLVASFQDEDHLYLLLPLVPGGDLYDRLHHMSITGRGMSNDNAAFYAACIIEGIGGGFHRAAYCIAYRDLKLENVMVDEVGYGKIVDLGFAKVISGLTYTLCGTPEMLAPEIIMSKGHDHSVDYWAFGVVVYELLVGHSPFYIRGSSQLDMFKRIVTVQYSIPSFVMDSAKAMIQALLVRKSSNRLGNLANGHLDIKQHPWFKESGINFKHIFRKETVAPWKPDIKDPFESSKHDNGFSRDSEVNGGRPLTREEQEIFKGF